MPLPSLHPLPANPTTGQQPLATLGGRSIIGPPPLSAGGGGGVNREVLKGLQDVAWSDDEVSPRILWRTGHLKQSQAKNERAGECSAVSIKLMHISLSLSLSIMPQPDAMKAADQCFYFKDDPDCLLCAEPLDLSDLNFKPCQCGMQVSSRLRLLVPSLTVRPVRSANSATTSF